MQGTRIACRQLHPFDILYSAKQAAAWLFLAELGQFLDVVASRTNHPQVQKKCSIENSPLSLLRNGFQIGTHGALQMDVLSHFRDDCEFETPIAATITNSARLRGKEALRNYWEAALARIKSLHFVLEDYVWDQEQRRLVVVYRSHTDGRVTSCVELMQFDPDGKQIYGRAYYGAAEDHS